MQRDATTEEVAASLHVGPATVRKYARQRRVPFDTTPGGHRRYNVGEVLQALGVDRVRPADAADASPIETPFVRVPAPRRRADVRVLKVHKPAARPHGSAEDHAAWAEETPVV